MIQNLVNTHFGAQTGFQNGVGNTPFGTAHATLAILLVVFLYSKILPPISLNVPFLQLNVNNCSLFSKGVQVQVQVLGLKPVMLLLS